MRTDHIKIHAKYMQDTCKIRILITNPTKFDNKPHVSRGYSILSLTEHVKRDTQKERATKRYSWGAKAVRVRATGSLRAHPLEVVGHSRRSPRSPEISVDRRPPWQVARHQRATLSRTRLRLQPFSTKGARCGADAFIQLSCIHNTPIRKRSHQEPSTRHSHLAHITLASLSCSRRV